MYGGLLCFNAGELDNKYYQTAQEKPSPLSGAFSQDYFNKMASDPLAQKLRVKAFLATEQRIPGLGNGVLQDILFNAKVHPKTKIAAHSGTDREMLLPRLSTPWRKSPLREVGTQKRIFLTALGGIRLD